MFFNARLQTATGEKGFNSVSAPSDAQSRRIVLAVTTRQSVGLLEGMADHLACQGWEVYVVSSGLSRVSASGVMYIDLTMKREPSPINDLLALARWFRLLRRLRPTAVVAGTPKAGLLGTLAAGMARVPVRIYMLRGLRLETESGLRRLMLSVMERAASKASTRVLAVSHSLRDVYTELGLAPRDKVVVLGSGSSNGVDVNRSQAVSRVESGEPIVGFVGRLSRDKGLDTLIPAVAGIPGAELLLVGPEEPPGYLGHVLQRHSVDHQRVRWVGWAEDVTDLYARMDVLCLPTLREGFPNVILEAAVVGVPAVASRVTGCVDAVEDGVTGLLFAPGDVGDLREKLEAVLRDPDYRGRLSEAGISRVRREFERGSVWSRTEAFFASEVAQARSADVITNERETS